MKLSRPLAFRAVLAGAVLATAGSAVLPAGAATTTTTTPSKGTATSTVTLLKLSIAGETVTTGQIVALADNAVSPHQVRLVLTPLDSTLTGPVGQQAVTPASSPATVASPTTPVTLPAGLGSVSGPAMQAGAQDGAAGLVATAAATALGTVNLLSVPLDLQTTSLSDTAKVLSTSASAEKSLSVGTVALPSLGDVLSSLGLDLTKTLNVLTQGNLTSLSGLVGGNVTTLNNAVDTAQAALGTAGQPAADSLGGALAERAGATSALSAANAAFTTAWNTAYGALPALVKTTVDTALSAVGLSSPLTPTQLLGLDPTTLGVLSTAFGASTLTSLTNLAQAAQTAGQVLTLVNNLVDALQALVNGVLSSLTGNTDPLASIGGLTMSTSAIAADKPSAASAVSAGSVNVLGVASSLADVNAALTSVGNTLKSVLGSVGVAFTPPAITLGTPQHATSTDGSTRKATASVSGLTLTLPTLAAPAALSTLNTALSAVAGSLTVGQLSEAAQWTPSSTTTTTTPGTTTPGTTSGHPGSPRTSTGGPTLATTGGTAAVPLAACVLLGAAAVLRRRRAA